MIRLLSSVLISTIALPTITTSEADLENIKTNIKPTLNLEEKFMLEKIPSVFDNIYNLNKKSELLVCTDNDFINSQKNNNISLSSSGAITNTGGIIDNTGTIVDLKQENNITPNRKEVEEKKVEIIQKKDYTDDTLMKLICKTGKLHGRVTPLCENWDLFYKLKDISKSKGVPFELALGISLRESHLGTNFNSTNEGVDDYICSSTNNWAGLKKRVNDEGLGLRTFIDTNGVEQKVSYPDQNGCWLYPFDSIEDFWISFNNTLKFGYISKGLDTPREIVTKYTGKTENTEGWVSTVGVFF